MAFPLALIGAGIGLAGGIGKMIGRGRSNREMRSLQSKDPQYVENPIAKQRMALAQTLLNARMPGAMQAERNIYQGAANTIGGAQRNATDATQLLALGAAAQGRQDQSFVDLSQAEAADFQRRQTNLEQAQQGMINEGDKVFDDRIRRFGNQVQFQGAMAENRQNTWGDISNMGFGLADFGLAGGFDKLMQGMRRQPMTMGVNRPPQIDQQGLRQAMQNLPKVGRPAFNPLGG